MTDLSAIAKNLTESGNGIWVANHESVVSYPDEGNEACFAVEDTSFWFQHRNQVILELVRKFSPNKCFFDIGGGNGCVANALQAAGVEVVLVEPGPTGAMNAKQRGVKAVVQSTLEDAGFAQESLPTVGLFDVTEHIEKDADFLRQIHNFMEPDGTLYLTVPAFQFLWSKDDELAGHYRRYTTKTLSNVLSEAGFEVKYCSYLFALLVPPIFLLRSLPSWFGFRKTVSGATTQKEHSSGKGFVSTIVQKLLNAELARVRNQKRIPIGSSCIVVATKKRAIVQQ